MQHKERRIILLILFSIYMLGISYNALFFSLMDSAKPLIKLMKHNANRLSVSTVFMYIMYKSYKDTFGWNCFLTQPQQ